MLYLNLRKQETISSNLQKQETSFNLMTLKYNVGGCVNAFGGDRWYLNDTWQQNTIPTL